MYQSPKNTISTAKFQQKVMNLETQTSQFDTTTALIQSMYMQIDEQIDSINKRIPKQKQQIINNEDSLLDKINQQNMIKADEESTNLQQYYLAIESEEISNVLNTQVNDQILQQTQMKKIILQTQQKINDLKQVYIFKYYQLLSQNENEYRDIEVKSQEIQEKQQSYAQLLLKLKEKQQQNDSIFKLIDQSAQSQWLKLRQLFDVDIIKTGISVENLIKLQQILLMESENLIQTSKHKNVLEGKKQLLLEIQLQNPLFSLVLSFDQILLNIVHQPKDHQISKQGILVQTIKCIHILHQNFCWLVQNLNKYNYSQKHFEDQSKEFIQYSSLMKQISQKKTQLMVEVDKIKKQQKEVQQKLQNALTQTEKKIECEVQNLVQMYLKDKEDLMRDIKFKYGKQYHDHMIMDVRQEFKKICISQHLEMVNKIDQAYLRMEQIDKKIIENKDKIINLLKNWREQQLNFGKKPQSQSQIDKKEFVLQLQNLKIILLQLENRIQKKSSSNSDCLLNELQIEINKLKQVIEENFVIQQKQRSDSIDQGKKIRAPEHGRSQSQIPIASTEISGIKLPIQNPQEIFDSQDDPIQIVKKPFSEQNSYQLSFNQNQSKSISNISEQQQSFFTQKESSLHGSILEAIQSNRNKKIDLNLIVFLQLKNVKKLYDPITNEDPQNYGYQLYRMDNQFNLYSSEERENFNSYQKFEQKLDVKQLLLDDISKSALKFKMIYEPSMRGICQDSLALRHLNMKYFPFCFQTETQQIHGLCLNEQDLIKLQLLQKQ